MRAVAFGLVGAVVVGVIVLGTAGDRSPAPAVPQPAPAPQSAPAPVSTIEPPSPPVVPTAPEPSPPPGELPMPAELDDESSAVLSIASTPTGALVFIDGLGSCYTPCSRRLPFGRHHVRLEHEERAIDRMVHLPAQTELSVSMTEP